MSRRKFTKEFKEAAVRRLELAASLARACEVNPNVLHRWKRRTADGKPIHAELRLRDRAGNAPQNYTSSSDFKDAGIAAFS